MTTSQDDLNSVTFTPDGDLFYVTRGNNSTPGTTNTDINRFTGSLGPVTSGTTSLELALSQVGISGNNAVDALTQGAEAATWAVYSNRRSGTETQPRDARNHDVGYVDSGGGARLLLESAEDDDVWQSDDPQDAPT